MTDIKDQSAIIIDTGRRLYRDFPAFAEAFTAFLQQSVQAASKCPSTPPKDEYLRVKQVAAMIGVCASTLEKWRKIPNAGPQWVRLEGRRCIRYCHSEVIRYMREREVK